MKTSDISVEYIQHCGDDLLVVNSARVSFHKESEWDICIAKTGFEEDELVKAGWEDVTNYDSDYESYYRKLKDSDAKLIKYLASHGHISPFHHSFITLYIKAPVFVARQLVKHKFMPWNEVSRRYVDDEPEFYFPDYWRKKADNVKQGSSDERCEAMYENADRDWLHDDYIMPLDDQVSLIISNQVLLYNEMIEKGVAPEQARMVLPQNTMTEWIWSGTLSAWASMLNLRLSPSTQKETRDVAEKAYSIIQPLFPVSIKALVDAH